jgi:transcriptional regulator with XRE-family HTH domain
MAKRAEAPTAFQIRIRMIELGLTQRAIAEKLGVTREMVNQVMRGRTKSARVAAGVAEALGYPVEVLFPNERRVA